MAVAYGRIVADVIDMPYIGNMSVTGTTLPCSDLCFTEPLIFLPTFDP